MPKTLALSELKLVLVKISDLSRSSLPVKGSASAPSSRSLAASSSPPSLPLLPVQPPPQSSTMFKKLLNRRSSTSSSSNSNPTNANDRRYSQPAPIREDHPIDSKGSVPPPSYSSSAAGSSSGGGLRVPETSHATAASSSTSLVGGEDPFDVSSGPAHLPIFFGSMAREGPFPMDGQGSG
ncbi:hypothetical protein BDY24DRAFT_55412 [Mrakia frigida]|uniref:uncharacterized protein n=1 Tax=Mrakia frigida TaxID=29902 RepID=UPI003FCC17BB